MKNDQELQKDVQDTLKWESLLKTAKIGVFVSNGIITLTGTVDSYFKKSHAEDVAKNVAGVKAVVEKIEVQFINAGDISDQGIAAEVLNALKLNREIPSENIKVKVEDGWVTLEGDVQWNYQKEAVTIAVKNLSGIKVFTNDIRIKPETQDEIGQKDIERALDRNWSMNNQAIHVAVSGNNVQLSGTVNSNYQKSEAEKIAWNAPGVWTVDNELVIEFKE